MKIKNTALFAAALPCVLLLAGLAGCNSDIPNPGKGTATESPTQWIGHVLPDWEEGCLDIHAINTGRGESTLYILPDGTTMLVDAAGSTMGMDDDPIPPTAPKPNGSITSGQVIINYVKHFIRPANTKLNYLLLTHFDTDHMGNFDTSLPMAPAGNFRMGGITEVGASLAFDKLIDRGWEYPKNRASETRIANYRTFINWAKTAYSATYEEFDVGKNDQIVLKKNPSKYTDFSVRNLFANGYVWTGAGSEKRNTFPSVENILAADPAENVYSIAFHLKYGRFDLFAGGDLQYNDKSNYAWKDVEAPVAQVMTAVDVMKANHHGTSNCNSQALLNKLSPKAIFIHTWRDVQANAETLGRMYTASPDCKIFLTNTTDPNKERLSAHLAKLNSLDGHIVIRVQPDELFTYCVYILDDTNENYIVKKAFGPYFSF